MKSFLRIFLLAIVITSCQKQEKGETFTNETKPIVENVKTINNDQLENFSFPNEINGCGCYFASSENDLLQEKYVFVDEIDQHTYFKIGEKLIKLNVTDNHISQTELKKTIENEDYKITLSGKRDHQNKEALYYVGQMKVLIKSSGIELETPIFGECGC